MHDMACEFVCVVRIRSNNISAKGPKCRITKFSAPVLLDPLAQKMLYYKKHCDWLAKIMGKDPESFSSEDLQVMEYL